MGAQLPDWALHLAVPLKMPSGREGGVLRRAGRKRWVPSERQEVAGEGTRHRGAGGATRKGSGEQGRALVTASPSAKVELDLQLSVPYSHGKGLFCFRFPPRYLQCPAGVPPARRGHLRSTRSACCCLPASTLRCWWKNRSKTGAKQEYWKKSLAQTHSPRA